MPTQNRPSWLKSVGLRRLAVLTLCVLALTNLRLLRYAVAAARGEVDARWGAEACDRYELLLAPAIADLPAGTEANFLSALPPGTSESAVELTLFRYAAVPLRVVTDRNRPLVLVRAEVGQPALPAGLRLVRNYGNGLALAQRDAAP